jgi:hypothetical protein
MGTFPRGRLARIASHNLRIDVRRGGWGDLAALPQRGLGVYPRGRWPFSQPILTGLYGTEAPIRSPRVFASD